MNPILDLGLSSINLRDCVVCVCVCVCVVKEDPRLYHRENSKLVGLLHQIQVSNKQDVRSWGTV